VNVKEAEAVLALSLEIENALVIAAAPIDDIHGRFAAERAIERIFQASEMVDQRVREDHFGVDGLKKPRGMRNRLAHNYLGIDADVIRETLQWDLPRVRDRLVGDREVASAIVTAERMDMDEVGWVLAHHAST
jgi:uncharacterized protein with HEPN domain